MQTIGNDAMDLNVTCNMCNHEFSVIVNKADYLAWRNGTVAQRAFPYLNADERELLISATCGYCWEKMFA